MSLKKEEIKNNTKPKTKISFVTLACCTYNRAKFLEMALLNLKSLKLPEDVRVEIVVVDNDAEMSAKKVIEKVQNEIPLKINYYVEKNRGLSNVRNKLLESCVDLGASHIMIFDDDGLIDSECLINHIDLYNNHKNASVISGPQLVYFTDRFPDYISKNTIFLQKVSRSRFKGEVVLSANTNNAFFTTEVVTKSQIWFDKSFVFMGGEDTDFFNRVRENGYVIVYNPDGIVREMIDENRANLKWIIERRYASSLNSALLKFRGHNGLLKKLFYSFKSLFAFVFNCIFLPFAILGGPVLFFNVLGRAAVNLGKVVGALRKTHLKVYN